MHVAIGTTVNCNRKGTASLGLANPNYFSHDFEYILPLMIEYCVGWLSMVNADCYNAEFELVAAALVVVLAACLLQCVKYTTSTRVQ